MQGQFLNFEQDAEKLGLFTVTLQRGDLVKLCHMRALFPTLFEKVG